MSKQITTCNVRDQHSASQNNKLFVELHERVTNAFTDEEIADLTMMARSTYNKVKLGYFPAYDYRIKALQELVDLHEEVRVNEAVMINYSYMSEE